MPLFCVFLAIFLAIFLVGIPLTWLLIRLTCLVSPTFDRWYSDLFGE